MPGTQILQISMENSNENIRKRMLITSDPLIGKQSIIFPSIQFLS